MLNKSDHKYKTVSNDAVISILSDIWIQTNYSQNVLKNVGYKIIKLHDRHHRIRFEKGFLLILCVCGCVCIHAKFSQNRNF